MFQYADFCASIFRLLIDDYQIDSQNSEELLKTIIGGGLDKIVLTMATYYETLHQQVQFCIVSEKKKIETLRKNFEKQCNKLSSFYLTLNIFQNIYKIKKKKYSTFSSILSILKR